MTAEEYRQKVHQLLRSYELGSASLKWHTDEIMDLITTYGLQKQNEVLDKAAEGISNIPFEEYQHEMSEGWNIDLYAGVAIGRKYSRLSILNLKNKL